MNDLTRSLFSVGMATGVLVAAEATVITSGVMAPDGKPLLAQSSRALEEQAFLEARRAINREEFEVAAELFAAFRDPASEFTSRYKADSYYWEAFARYRLGDLPEALILLDALEGGYDEYRNFRGVAGRLHDEVFDLRLRIRRQQAEQGDPRAAEEVLRQSEALLHPELLQAYSDSARRAHTAALAVQEARSDSVRREYAAALEAQRERADSARRAYSAALEAYRTGSIPAALAVADTMVEQLNESVSVLQGELAATRSAAAQVTDVVTAQITDVMTAQVTDVVAAMARAGRVSQVPEGCENVSVQQAALSALLRLETERMPSVRSVLESQDECSVNLRRQAIDWLARQGTSEAQRELITLAESHPDAETRESATRGLVRFPNLTAVDALSRILATTEDSGVRTAAIAVLRQSEPVEARRTLLGFAKDLTKPLELRQTALTAYGRRSDVTPEELMRLLDQPVLRGLETVVLQSLGRRVQTGEEGVASFLFGRAMDKRRSVEVRTAALEAWSRAPSVDLEHLAQSYEELEEPDLKERIFYALYRKTLTDDVAAPAVVDKMIELARGEDDREIRERAVHWIGRTGSERAVEFLLELLRQRPGDPPDTEVRQYTLMN